MRGVGYLVSIVSVVLLGLVAWPEPQDPAWHLPVLLTAMGTSIVGMALRWTASRKQLHELHQVEERTGAMSR